MKPWSEKSQDALIELKEFYSEKVNEICLKGRGCCPLCKSVMSGDSIDCQKCPWKVMTGALCGSTHNIIDGYFPSTLRVCEASNANFIKAIKMRISQIIEWIKYYEES